VRLFRSRFNFALAEKESQGLEKATATTSLRIKALKQGFWFPPQKMVLFQEVKEQHDG
jgi:hypothetical protein